MAKAKKVKAKTKPAKPPMKPKGKKQPY